MDYIELKEKLLSKCYEYVEQRISTSTKAMDQAQEAAISETKSSAGDKYETGRSMMQLEHAQNARHLEEAMKLKQVLDQVKTGISSGSVNLGSLVITTSGKFYLAIGLGKIEVEKQEFIVLAPVSPLGKALMGKKNNETASFNKQEYKILEIY